MTLEVILSFWIAFCVSFGVAYVIGWKVRDRKDKKD